MVAQWHVAGFCARVGTKARTAFPFMGVRCDRVVHSVLQRLAELRIDNSRFTHRFLCKKSKSTRIYPSARGATLNGGFRAPTNTPAWEQCDLASANARHSKTRTSIR